MDLPFITSDIPPIQGVIKADYEDFIVHELPLYEPCGEGDHTYFIIEKRGLTTHQAIRDIARAIGVRPRDIGAAGNKDARGVTRQTLSVEHVPPDRLESLDLPRLEVVSVSRHRNKLRLGHLRGNRFAIKLREVDLPRLEDVRRIIATLWKIGTPNYFGPQRFGNRGDTWQIGLALLRGDFELAAAVGAGRPASGDTGRVLEARTLFDEGRYRESARAWPSGYEECRSLAAAMSRFKGDCERAMLSLDKRTLGFYVSALQSRLFNEVLARRIAEIDCVRTGDVAWKHDNGAAFLVEDGERELPRAKRFEISATGPLFGKRMKLSGGEVADLETSVLEAAGLRADELPSSGPLKCPGGRRPFRFQLQEADVKHGEDGRGAFIEIGFVLPAGCYATAVFREIQKNEVQEGPSDRGAEEKR
jgi:tRNA pseudouridine13 synthase